MSDSVRSPSLINGKKLSLNAFSSLNCVLFLFTSQLEEGEKRKKDGGQLLSFTQVFLSWRSNGFFPLLGKRERRDKRKGIEKRRRRNKLFQGPYSLTPRLSPSLFQAYSTHLPRKREREKNKTFFFFFILLGLLGIFCVPFFLVILYISTVKSASQILFLFFFFG